MDFVFDGTAGGRAFRTLNVIDRFTRECLVIEVDTSITGQRVVAVLALLVAMHGTPQSIRIDNGASNNTVGGAADGAANTVAFNGGPGVLVLDGTGNEISGNRTWGVYISDSLTNNNLVANNLIGTNVAGTFPVPNTNNGLDIVFGAQGNTVGGTTAAARNVI